VVLEKGRKTVVVWWVVWQSAVLCVVAVVNGDTADEVYARVTEVIRDHSELVVWVPVHDNP